MSDHDECYEVAEQAYMSGDDAGREAAYRAVLDEMAQLMQPQKTGRYLDATECWNTLLEFVRERV